MPIINKKLPNKVIEKIKQLYPEYESKQSWSEERIRKFWIQQAADRFITDLPKMPIEGRIHIVQYLRDQRLLENNNKPAGLIKKKKILRNIGKYMRPDVIS